MHNEYFYTTKAIKENIKLALLSDIHYHYPGYNTKIFTKLNNQIKKVKPNYICIVGDTLDEANCDNIEQLKQFLKEIANIAPVIVVSGNHEQKRLNKEIKKWEYYENKKLFKTFEELENVFYLDDNIYEDKTNNIAFYGINLSFKHYELKKEAYNSFEEEINKLKCNLNNNYYNITLLHSPINIYTFIKNNPTHKLNQTDLILNGHMHNGCIPFTFTNIINKLFKTNKSLISPYRKLFPNYSQGKVHNIKDGYIYQGIIKFSNINKKFSKFNCLYSKKIQFITIKKSSE